MGAPAFQMLDLIEKNNVAVFSSNFALYGDMSQRVMDVLAKFSPDLEIYSIDEAFLDLTGQIIKDYEAFGHKIRNTIMQWTGIPVSVGISTTKTLAKVANHLAKKHDGFNSVVDLTDPDNFEKALKLTPVADIWGVGRQYARLLKEHNIHKASELVKMNDAWIRKNMHVIGLRTIEELRGKSCITMETILPDKKGITYARSFGNPLTEFSDIEEALSTFTSRCAAKIRKQGSLASVIMVFVMTNRFSDDPKYVNYKIHHLTTPSNNTPELIGHSTTLLKLLFKKGYKYKKVGVIFTDLISETNEQLSFWDHIDRNRQKKIMPVLDRITATMGKDVVKYAIQGTRRRWKLKQEKLSPAYTTKWDDLLKIDLK
jgi:DNA polymerase V